MQRGKIYRESMHHAQPYRQRITLTVYPKGIASNADEDHCVPLAEVISARGDGLSMTSAILQEHCGSLRRTLYRGRQGCMI